MGSCFAVHIGKHMAAVQLPITTNPFGILYNPASIGNSLTTLLLGKDFEASELYEHRGIWVSFAHHGSFSHHNPDKCLQQMNHSREAAQQKLLSAHYLIITFGTSFIYKRKDTGQIVANCHQLPDAFFDRSLLSVADIVEQWQCLLQDLFAKNPNLCCLFTLSPVRHWKDGATDNHYSKSLLTVAIRELITCFADRCAYFPAYEIMLDDLRDYRFYEADMLHPNAVAIDYIWQKFAQSYLHAPETQRIMKAVLRINADRQHRPRHPDSAAHRAFVAQTARQIAELTQQYPFLCFDEQM